MAETFVAVRRGPGGFEQHVCIKRILPAFETDVEFVESFLQEARTSATLRHANIVQLLDFGVADGAHYLALELVDGLDLRALAAGAGLGTKRGRLSPELTGLIAGDLCAALEHAHGADEGRPAVVHRDISPSNVLVSRAGEVKLTDFGIARAIGGRHRTATGVIKGKVPYMPPEYIERGVFDQRGDLFSLGVLLYELLTGVRPYDGDTDLDTIRRIMAGVHTPLATLAPDTPPQLAECVEYLLCLDPAQRFPSARSLLEALPSIQVHQARRRLADMVRAQIGSAPRPTPGALSQTVPLQPERSSQPYERGRASQPPPNTPSAEATRTARRPAGRSSSSGRAWLALALALTCLGAVAVASVWYSDYLAPLPPLASSVPAPPVHEPPAAARSGPAALSNPLPSVVREPAVVPEPVAPEAAPEPEDAPSEPEPELPRAAPIVLSEPSELPAPRAPNAARPRERSAGAASAGRTGAELRIYVQPFGEVWIDGKRAGQSPVSVKLPPGEHEIGVGDARIEQRRNVALKPGETQSVEIRRKEFGE
jgi:serine/threonine protein kinase